MDVPTHSTNPLRRIREILGFSSQKEFAAALGMLPQHVSRAERRETLSRPFERKLRNYLQNRSKEDAARVEQLLGGRLWLGESVLHTAETSTVKSGWDTSSFPPVEREAWAWALCFRNSTILEELAACAIRADLGCSRLRDGIVLTKRTSKRKPKTDAPWSVLPQPTSFDLRPGTVVLLGASKRHTHSRGLVEEFGAQLGLDIGITEFPGRPAYFGYPTVLKHLTVGSGAAGKSYHSNRYADGDSVIYEDILAICHGPLERFYGSDHLFGHEAKRLVCVAALQRLGNGIGVRLVVDKGFRMALLPDSKLEGSFDPESENEIGMIILKVIVVHNDYGNAIRKIEVIERRKRNVADEPL